MPETIQCPKCGTEIEVAEAFSAGVEARLRSEILAEVTQKESGLAKREAQLKGQQVELEATVAGRVAEEQKRLLEEATAYEVGVAIPARFGTGRSLAKERRTARSGGSHVTGATG